MSVMLCGQSLNKLLSIMVSGRQTERHNRPTPSSLSFPAGNIVMLHLQTCMFVKQPPQSLYVCIAADIGGGGRDGRRGGGGWFACLLMALINSHLCARPKRDDDVMCVLWQISAWYGRTNCELWLICGDPISLSSYRSVLPLWASVLQKQEQEQHLRKEQHFHNIIRTTRVWILDVKRSPPKDLIPLILSKREVEQQQHFAKERQQE